jgi:hypothetical protein
MDGDQHDEPNACFVQLFKKCAKGGIFLKKYITWSHFKNMYRLQFVREHAVLYVGSI